MTSPEPTLATVAARRNSLSALRITREAIARWTGAAPAATLPKDVYRVSPQARHLDQARRNLAAWIADGGFAQEDAAPLMAPVMYRPRPSQAWQNSSDIGIDACMD
jgi:hypothetical protein